MYYIYMYIVLLQLVLHIYTQSACLCCNGTDIHEQPRDRYINNHGTNTNKKMYTM